MSSQTAPTAGAHTEPPASTHISHIKEKAPSRCSQPGYKKLQRAAQLAELGARGAPAAPAPVPTAARASAFTLAADTLPSELMDMLREVDADKEARMLGAWAEHNRAEKRARRHHG
ncbi:hypothetical protein ABPG75_009870 [Micractinium tetrahymenae]